MTTRNLGLKFFDICIKAKVKFGVTEGEEWARKCLHLLGVIYALVMHLTKKKYASLLLLLYISCKGKNKF